MSASVVRTKLLTVLNSVTSIPTVYEEADNFKPTKTSDYPFTRFTFLPRESVKQDTSSGKVSAAGLARIDLFYSRTSNSVDTALAMAESVVAAFAPTVTILSNCQLIVEVCWYEATRQEASTINVPIFVRWTSYSI